MKEPYRLRTPKLEWKLPTVKPVLRSGKDLQETCGLFKYDITTLAPPSFYTVVDSADYTTPIQMSIESADETIVLDYGPMFERNWTGALLTGYFPSGLYPELVFKSPFKLWHQVSDYCLGWKYRPLELKVLNDETVVGYSSEETPTIGIRKYLLSEETIFQFAFVSYQQLDLTKIDTGCGNLVYKPHFWTNDEWILKNDPWNRDFRQDLIWKDDADYIQEEGLRFHVVPNYS